MLWCQDPAMLLRESLGISADGSEKVRATDIMGMIMLRARYVLYTCSGLQRGRHRRLLKTRTRTHYVQPTRPYAKHHARGESAHPHI